MKLNDEQLEQLRGWIDEEATLGEIQKRLKETFDLNLTFMDTRFLLEDYDLRIKIPEPETADDEGGEAGTEGSPTDPSNPDDAESGGSVDVSVDSIARPDAMISGTVTFTGGQKSVWYIDQGGRLGLDADDPSFRPSEEEFVEFQTKLQKVIETQQL